MARARQSPISEGLPPLGTRRRERFSRRMLALADASAGAIALLLVVELGPGRGLAPSTLVTWLLVFACKHAGGSKPALRLEECWRALITEAVLRGLRIRRARPTTQI